ncbi:MAG: hypothetical protein ACI4HJ_04800 [Ruminococcus sp.]
MNDQIRAQVLKALAYGEAPERIAEVMNVNAEDIASITQGEIEEERAYLSEIGMI